MPEELITNAEDIRLNEQDQVQTILGKPPGWILRWGITFIFLAVLLLIWISWLVKFPDVISARVLLTTEVPPVHLFVQSDGKIEKLLASDQTEVNVNELLAIIQNPADYDDVMDLEEFLLEIIDQSPVEIAKANYPQNLNLGELQNTYAVFTQDLNDYNFFQNKKEIGAKVKALKSQIRYLGRMNVSLGKEENKLEEAIELSKSNRNRMEKLQAEQAVSIKEVEDAKAQVLIFEREKEQLESQILNNKLRVKDLELQIISLQENRRDGKNEKSNSIKENIEILLSAIENWKQKYLVVAPMEGIISFPSLLNQNQFVKNGQEIMTIVPKGGVGEMVGNASLPAMNSGKVKEGMEVNIRWDGYSYQEFGVVQASVKSKSILPQDGNYLVEIEMPEILETTYGDTIPFQQEMQGTANIITEDRRILERIFDRVLSLIKNR